MAHREVVPAQGESNLKIEFCGDKLEDDNWVAWKWHITKFLRSKNLIDVIQADVGGTRNDVVLTLIGREEQRANQNSRLVKRYKSLLPKNRICNPRKQHVCPRPGKQGIRSFGVGSGSS